MKTGMRVPKKQDILRAAEVLTEGGVGILPTDTIYGLVGPALLPRTVARIYRLRRRNQKKPVIVLISSLENLHSFGIRPNARARRFLSAVWPGKVSVVLPCPRTRFAYLHRGTRTIAFRLPAPAWLRRLIARTGPLAAPSANFEGSPPARTIRAAKKYFGSRADLYIDGGTMGGIPSTLVAIGPDGRATILREGAVKIDPRLIRR